MMPVVSKMSIKFILETCHQQPTICFFISLCPVHLDWVLHFSRAYACSGWSQNAFKSPSSAANIAHPKSNPNINDQPEIKGGLSPRKGC